MTALTILGILCLILLCFGPAIELLHFTSSKLRPTQIDKNGKRELKINRIVFWDYLILIFPLLLLLIGLFSNNLNERNTSLMLLGIGYMIFILSSNNRIDIPKINWFIFVICIIVTVTYLLFKQPSITYKPTNTLKGIDTLIFPTIAYVFLHTARQLIRLLTGVFPITMMKYDKVGQFNFRFQRKTTYWDLAWSMVSLALIPMLIVCLSLKK